MNTSYGHYNLDARSLESVCFIQSLDLKKKKKRKKFASKYLWSHLAPTHDVSIKETIHM